MAQADTGRQMDWRVCCRILSEAAAMGVAEVAFSGGEPLLWEHLNDIVRLASTHGMRVCLYTTGNVLNAEMLLDELHAAGLRRVVLSVFGADAQRHDAVTIVAGSYDVTIRAATHCVGSGLETEFHFVPMGCNSDELPMIAKQARALGVARVSVLRLVPHGRGAEVQGMQLTAAQNLKLRRSILDLRMEGHDIRVGSPYNFLMLREHPECCSGIDRLTIGPDLCIFPCDAFKHISPEKIGVGSEYSNLHDGSLAECWERSPYLQTIRQYLTTDFAQQCSACEALDHCLSGCMAQKFYACGELRKCPDPMCLMSIRDSSHESP